MVERRSKSWSALPVMAPVEKRLALVQRRRANDMWKSGKKERSVELLRKTRRAFPNDAQTALSLGTKLFQLGIRQEARAALIDCLELDPGNVKAFEYIRELEAEFPLTGSRRRALLNGIAESYDPSSPDWAAKLFFIAGWETEYQSVRTTIDGILARGSGMDFDIIRFLDMGEEQRRDALSAVLASDGRLPDLAPALLACEVIRGSITSADQILEARGAEGVPADILRLAGRREMRRKRWGNARKYLKAYLTQVESDGWATATLAKIDSMRDRVKRRGKTAVAPSQDFEFSSRVESRDFDLVGGRVRYFLHNSLPFDSAGYATRTHGLLTALNRHGWDAGGVTRFGYPFDKEGFDPTRRVGPDQIDGVLYQRLVNGVTLPVRKTPVQAFVNRYVESAEELVRTDKPAVLHGASNHWNGLAVAELGRRFDIPTVYEVRGLWELTRASREPGYELTRHYRERAAIEAKAANACDRVITITGALAEEMIDRGVPEDKITVVPNGVDTTRFTPLGRDEELGDRLGIRGRTVVGYVGSILDYEGIDDLVDVAERLVATRDDVVFLIVGDGAKFAEISARVEDANLRDSVILTGRVPHDEVAAYYSLIDICPFPRKPLPVCEAVSPLKPFEALAMGKVILGSNVAAIAEIIDDGVTGLLFEKGNKDSLQERLEKLLDESDLRVRVGQAGLEWVRGERDWLQLGARVDALYREMGVVPPTEGRHAGPPLSQGL